MSDAATERLISAINEYTGAFGEDRRFDRVLDVLRDAKDRATDLDPVADRDLQGQGQRDDGSPASSSMDGQPDEEPRYRAQEPPLSRAGRRAREALRRTR